MIGAGEYDLLLGISFCRRECQMVFGSSISSRYEGCNVTAAVVTNG